VVALVITLPKGLGFITKNSLCELCVSSEAGGAALDTHAIYFVHPLVSVKILCYEDI